MVGEPKHAVTNPIIAPATQAVWEADATGQMVTDSPSWRAFTGQTLEEWLGEGWANAIHPEERPKALEGWRAHVRTGEPLLDECRVQSPDGGWRWTQVRAFPLRTPDGAIEKWIGLNLDISEHRQTKAKLADTENRYHLLFDSMDQGVQMTELVRDDAGTVIDTRLLEVNRAWQKITGIDPAEVLGRPTRQWLKTVDTGWLEMMVRIMCTGVPERREGFIPELGRWFDVFTTPLGSDRFISLITDTTRRRQDEEALRSLLAERETLLKELHHRVKNNLGVIDSLLQLQAGAISNTDARAALAEASNRVHAIAEVHRLLYQTSDLSNVDLATYASSLANALYSALRRNEGIELAFETEPVHLDLRRAVPLGLVLNELLTSTFQHAFPGDHTGTVGVGIHKLGNVIEMSVTHDGVAARDGLASLGRKLVDVLAEQLHAELVFETGERTRIRLRVPLER